MLLTPRALGRRGWYLLQAGQWSAATDSHIQAEGKAMGAEVGGERRCHSRRPVARPRLGDTDALAVGNSLRILLRAPAADEQRFLCGQGLAGGGDSRGSAGGGHVRDIDFEDSLEDGFGFGFGGGGGKAVDGDASAWLSAGMCITCMCINISMCVYMCICVTRAPGSPRVCALHTHIYTYTCVYMCVHV